jgi:FkbM family methyltransferase
MLRRVPLPNQLDVWAPNAFEAAVAYREIVTEDTYLSHGIALDRGAVVFDIGANVGLFAIHLARTIPEVTVHAFEPVPQVFEALQRNLAEHAPGARARNVGLADDDCEATFEVDRFMTIGATMHPRVFDRGRGTPGAVWAAAAIDDAAKVAPSAALRLIKSGLATPVARHALLALLAMIAAGLAGRRWLFLRHPRCRLVTLSSALAASGVSHVDLVKIDVEGAEEQVLAGIADDDWPRIRQLVIEVHDVDHRLDRLTALLARRGYRTTHAREDWALHDLLGISTLYAVRADA